MKQAAISVLGKDRTGIVASITKALFETGCNIEDSSMTLLKSEFAMIVLVELPPKLTFKELSSKLQSAVKKLNLAVSIKPLEASEIKKEINKGNSCMISLFGADKPGIVYTVSSFLAKNNINITDVQTNISQRNSKKTYIMILEADIPKTIKLNSISSKLKDLAGKLNVYITINPLESSEL